ncbi:MAG: substrate-binding domain-containing protein [Verrucomicrobiae bacterium]|nr:substrate-binding domain-containing protein [Verrucomicrobiae bacterium]
MHPAFTTETDDHAPLSEQCIELLRDQIRKGQVAPGQYLPSVRSLANRMNINPHSVWLGLRHLRNEGVLEQCPNGRYKVFAPCSPPKAKQLLRAAFLAHGHETIFLEIYRRIYDELHKLEQSENLHLTCLLDTENSPITDDYDALIFADWQPENTKHWHKGFRICLDRRATITAPWLIATDHFRGGQLAAEHLCASQPAKVMYIDAPTTETFLPASYRHLGFQKSWLDLTGRPENLIHHPIHTWDFAEMAQSAEKALSAGCKAIFCYSDYMAVIICEHLISKGVAFPDDMSLMGYDGSYQAIRHEPRITTIQQPTQEIALAIIRHMRQADVSSNTPLVNLIPPVLAQGMTTPSDKDKTRQTLDCMTGQPQAKRRSQHGQN